MKKFFILLIMLIMYATPQALFANTVPAGTFENSIWFSKDPFFANDDIFIHALVFNSSPYNLEGTFTLYNGTTTIGSKYFTLSGGGASSIISFPWVVPFGTHAFHVVIDNAILTNGKTRMSEIISTPKTFTVTRVADIDTDHDGIGDMRDPDDDNDGLSDVVEKKLGTDPLRSDTDGDKIPDATDAKPLTPYVVPPSNSNKLSPAGTITTAITNYVPTPVRESASPIIGTAESYRLKSLERIEGGLERVTLEMIASQGASSTLLYAEESPGGWEIFRNGVITKNVIDSPFAYVKLLFLLLGEFITENSFVFYVCVMFLLYLLIRFIWSLIP